MSMSLYESADHLRKQVEQDESALRSAVLKLARTELLHEGMKPKDVEWMQNMAEAVAKWGSLTARQAEVSRRIVLRYCDLLVAYDREKTTPTPEHVIVAAEALIDRDGFGDF